MEIILEAIIVAVAVGIGITIFGFIYRRECRREKATEHILGQVVGYASRNQTPRVEYLVDGEMYHTHLGYQVVVTISTPFSSPISYTEDDPLDTVIVIRNNSLFSFNGLMRHHFPVGTLLNVYYCKDNPKLAYVERYVGLKDYAFCFIVFLVFVGMCIELFIWGIWLFPQQETILALTVFPTSFLALGVLFYQILFKPVLLARKRKSRPAQRSH